MKNKATELLKNKSKTMPILSFPSVKLLNASVKDLVNSAEKQSEGMYLISKNCDIGASVSMMDLSVEAEAFGAEIRFYENDVPAVIKGIINDIEDVADIRIPDIGDGRTGIFIEAIKKAKEKITDIPVFCGVIGPYSLAGRLFDMQELMLECYDNPDKVKFLLNKATEFIIKYIDAFKNAGADGVIIAEPAAGLLSPTLAEEFSMEYVQKICEKINEDDFLICYHNCGSSAQHMLDMIGELDADIIHLGNSIDIRKALEIIPENKIIMGNIDPILFLKGNPDKIKNELLRLYSSCAEFPNFMLSTGCDIPAASEWENINAYFDTVNELYK